MAAGEAIHAPFDIGILVEARTIALEVKTAEVGCEILELGIVAIVQCVLIHGDRHFLGFVFFTFSSMNRCM